MASQSVDELIMCLVGMGFQLDDAQQAVQAGKLAVEDAVEWILGGKPPVTGPGSAPPPSLRLNRASDQHNPVGSNPFSHTQPPTAAPSSGTQSASVGESTDQPELDERLESRYKMKDEQRVIKEKFEEKERHEARDTARRERAAQKKAHQQILKEIQADREQVRIKTAKSGTAVDSSPEKKLKESTSGTQVSPGPPTSPPQASGNCLIQIRLPDGRCIRNNFEAGATLMDVWRFVEQSYPQCTGMGLMQPFPRIEFGDEHMTQTLQDLQLVPRSSLVLNKKEAKKEEEAMETENKPEQPEEEDAPPLPPVHIDPPFMGAGGIPHPPPPPGGYVASPWGQGNILGGQPTGPPAGEEQAPGEGSDDGEDDEAEMEGEDQGPDVVGGAVGGPPAWAAPHQWGQLPPQDQHEHDDWAWGQGQRLVGDVFEPENLPHHHQDPKQKAAEAANQRFGQRVPEEPSTSAAPTPATYQVLPLVQQTIQHVSRRICDTRSPIHGMQGVPGDVAMKVLDHLLHQRLLKPKTLQPFISCHLQRLVLDCYPYTTNELLAAIRYHTYLQHLSLCSCPLINDNGLKSLMALKRLKLLNLASCQQLTNNCVPTICRLESLVTLVLENTGITDAGVRQYGESAPQNLQHLNLNRTEVTHLVLPALQAIPNLKSVSLEQTKLASLSGIQNLHKLESLNIASTPIVTDSLLCLANHPSLVALNISNTPNVEGDLALQYISGLKLHLLQLPSRLTTTDNGMQFIAGMPLQVLDLTNYIQVGDAGAESIGRIHTLRRLRLSNTKITDQGMVFLEGLKGLEELLLDRTVITDSGAAVVHAFTRLQELSLSETCISDKFLQEKTLSSCPMLSKLNLSRTSISDKGVLCLRSDYLSLVNLDGTRVRPDTVLSFTGWPRDAKVSINALQPPPEHGEDD